MPQHPGLLGVALRDSLRVALCDAPVTILGPESRFGDKLLEI